jgi:hypothetical protein
MRPSDRFGAQDQVLRGAPLNFLRGFGHRTTVWGTKRSFGQKTVAPLHNDRLWAIGETENLSESSCTAEQWAHDRLWKLNGLFREECPADLKIQFSKLSHQIFSIPPQDS